VRLALVGCTLSAGGPSSEELINFVGGRDGVSANEEGAASTCMWEGGGANSVEWECCCSQMVCSPLLSLLSQEFLVMAPSPKTQALTWYVGCVGAIVDRSSTFLLMDCLWER